MRIYPHGNTPLPADFRRGLYAPLLLLEGEPAEVPDPLGELLVGMWPMLLCRIPEGERARDHYCHHRPRPDGPEVYAHTEMESPPFDREMVPARRRGRPPGALLAKLRGRK